MMECPSSGVNGNEYYNEFCNRIDRMRVPLSGTFGLTHRCNLRCIHCYVGSARHKQDASRAEMDTPRVLSVLDEVRDAGCLYLLITGGEPLLRPDFEEVYGHAKNNGMIVTVFTNGTLVNQETVDLFADLPPKLVEISLYGATRETYEKVTGIPASFDACMKGIESLLDRGIRVGLKTILMSTNSHEFYDIQGIARSYDVKFRFDAAIFPRFDGDMSPLSLRVPVDDVLKKELSDQVRYAEWKEFLGRYGNVKLNDRLYSCGAGVTNFYVDPQGFLMPCLMVKHLRHDLLDEGFVKGWGKMARLRELKAKPGRRCSDCNTVNSCGYCPAFFLMENGDENLHSDYLCDLGRERFSALNKT